nr:hypothetical protein StreXyl84_58060 [Streptomyces sp. Xyl84]
MAVRTDVACRAGVAHRTAVAHRAGMALRTGMAHRAGVIFRARTVLGPCTGKRAPAATSYPARGDRLLQMPDMRIRPMVLSWSTI